jgi:hypothetical protein
VSVISLKRERDRLCRRDQHRATLSVSHSCDQLLVSSLEIRFILDLLVLLVIRNISDLRSLTVLIACINLRWLVQLKVVQAALLGMIDLRRAFAASQFLRLISHLTG